MIEYLAEHGIVIVLILIYIAFCLMIGWYFKVKASSGVKEYYLAKREIPGWVISLAFFSTSASTNTYIGMAGKSYEYGLSWTWVGFIWVMFCMIAWLLLGPRMRKQSTILNSFTVPDYFQFRYKSELSKSIRILSAITILFATMWYMVGIAKGCAHVMETVIDVPYALGAFLILFITLAYTVWGGMYSVLWTDAVQGIIMFGVAILMLSLPFFYVGGVEPLFDKISNLSHPDKFGNPMGGKMVVFGTMVTFLYIVGIGLSIGMKQIADPKSLIRFYSIRDSKGMKFAMIWTPIFLGVSLICVMGLGALVHGMTTQEEASYLINHTDEVIGFMLDKIGNSWISGICVAGLFAAGMSSLASVILIVGTAGVQDIWHTIKPFQTDRKIIWYTKMAMILYCLIVYLITLYPPAGIVELTAFAGAVFASSFFPAVFGGLYVRWGTDAGALASMVTGMVMAIVWRFLFRFNYPGLENIHEIIPAFLISCLVYVLVSRMTSLRAPSSEHLAQLFKS